MTRVIGLAFIYFMLLNYRLKIYTPVSLLIICSGQHIGIVKNYLFVYKFLEKFKSSAVHKNTLKAMPFRMADLPEFIAFTAMVSLNIVLNNIDGQMDLLNNESPEVRLESMQFMREKLNSVLKDQCAEANAKIAHANDVGFHDTARYHGWYVESSTYYGSQEFARAQETVRTLKLGIIDLHQQGVTNEDSFKYQAGSQVLKKVQSDFPDAWKQPLSRWNSTYSTRVPRWPVRGNDDDVD